MKILEFILAHYEAISTLIAAILVRAYEKPKAEKKAIEKAKETDI